MLSRRIVRVKVMQLLYNLQADKQLGASDLQGIYRKGVNQTYDLFLFSLYVVLKTTRIALEEEERRKAKLLPKDEDRNFTPKLYQNPLIQELENSEHFTSIIEKKNFAALVDGDLVRQIYRKFAKEEVYREYVYSESGDKEHRKALLDLFRFMRKSEVFEELLESNYSNWEDDKSLVVGAVKKVVKALPGQPDDFLKEHYPDEETWKEFGEQLLQLTIEEDSELRKTISPTLKNWDEDRLNTVDNILIKMALCEMLHFPTIPTTVTINEYMEISKDYSTARSKDFLNGILDKLAGDLREKGMIKKKGRGLKG
ncbi:MAG: transcription antitermination factor NusB [Saprospirales bacterium]|nr:MAG: transcription antitermination factor NusB [Saprospirales bacterium]